MLLADETTDHSLSTSHTFFTVITVVHNDVWALSKTIKSVAMQSFKDFQYVIIDGRSTDNTASLISFWEDSGLVAEYVSEPDTGVYDAMNKGVRFAHGEYVCFMNAGDVFSTTNELLYAYDTLHQDPSSDGLLGWGGLKDQIWSSWHVESDSIRMSSLGFCHQALYLKCEWLQRVSFDARPQMTDSDTRQLADCISQGARIKIALRVMANRSASDGLSANLELSKISISETIVSGYENISTKEADAIISFRRNCESPDSMFELLTKIKHRARYDLAIMILDTLFLKQSKTLSEEVVQRLIQVSSRALGETDSSALPAIWRLKDAQSKKLQLLNKNRRSRDRLHSENLELQKTLLNDGYLSPTNAESGEYVISFTTFPQRVNSLHLVLQSLVSQTLPPKELFLVVGRDEFRNEWAFPKEVLNFREQGLTIVFVEKTSHQYDKFLHNMTLNSSLPFVIIDDDVIYPPKAMQRLMQYNNQYADCVIANRCHRMLMDEHHELLPYSHWQTEVTPDEPSDALFATGAGGVLFPKGFFTNCASMETMLALCPYADDVWLKTMALLSGFQVKSTDAMDQKDWKLDYTPDMREFALHEGNVDFGLNDIQLSKALNWLEAQGVDWKRKMRHTELTG